jgi:putative membrane protein
MMGYGGHMSGWGWIGAMTGMLVFWGLLALVVVAVYRAFTRDRGGLPPEADPSGTNPTASDPKQILAERFARGEINADEYRSRTAALDDTNTARPTR